MKAHSVLFVTGLSCVLVGLAMIHPGLAAIGSGAALLALSFVWWQESPR